MNDAQITLNINENLEEMSEPIDQKQLSAAYLCGLEPQLIKLDFTLVIYLPKLKVYLLSMNISTKMKPCYLNSL